MKSQRQRYRCLTSVLFIKEVPRSDDINIFDTWVVFETYMKAIEADQESKRLFKRVG
jgi:hypothetical protein